MKLGGFPGRRKNGGFALDERLSSLADWRAYADAHPKIVDAVRNDAVAHCILRRGFVEPLTERPVTPAEIGTPSGNWREELLANGLNSRMRATLMVLADHLGSHHPNEVRIFATEAVTALALILRGRYPKFLGSEYAVDEKAARAIFPVPHQDLTKLTLPSDVFDLVTTNEVLEHVPDLDRGLAEIARVLKPGGWHIGTHPFRFTAEEGDVRSQLVDGRVVYLKEPEIHGNPVDPTGGSLVFETPGWNIVARARAAGFSQAFMRLVAAERHGVVTQHGGVFVFCAQK